MLPFCSRSGGSTAKKWFQGSARSNWDPRERQQPFRPKPNGVGDHTTTLRQLLIGAGKVLSPLLFAIVVDVITENARGVVNELLYADDLVLMSKTIKDLKERFWNWEDALEKV